MRSLGIPFPPKGDLDCRDVIVEKPCIVGAQPTGKCSEYNVAVGFLWFIFYNSPYILKVRASNNLVHYNDVIMGAMASEITSNTIV